MGLNIYKYQLKKPCLKFLLMDEIELLEKHGIEIFDLDDNKYIENKLDMFVNFSKYIIYKIVDLFDWKATFQKRKLNINDFVFDKSYYDNDVGFSYVWIKKEDFHIEEIFYEEDLVYFKKFLPHLCCKRISYQRKGMEKNFYTHFSKIKFVYNNQLLEKAKRYSKPNEDFLNWDLKENEFIYFSI